MQKDRIKQASERQYNQPNYLTSNPAKVQALKYFETMYGGIPSAHAEELSALLESALVREMTNGTVIVPIVADGEVNRGEKGIYGFLSKFSRENALLLAKWGIPVVTPYENMMKYLPNFKKTFALQESVDLGKFIHNRPENPQHLPSLADVVGKYGRNSPEFEKALQERRQAIEAWEKWQEQHIEFQPFASL
jgi:hypothetical protein